MTPSGGRILIVEDERAQRDALAQYLVHVAGAIVMSAGLILFYGGIVPLERVDPVLALSSFAVLIGGALMLYMVVRMPKAA